MASAGLRQADPMDERPVVHRCRAAASDPLNGSGARPAPSLGRRRPPLPMNRPAPHSIGAAQRPGEQP
jgi:hypothetical protein